MNTPERSSFILHPSAFILSFQHARPGGRRGGEDDGVELELLGIRLLDAPGKRLDRPLAPDLSD